MTNKNTRLVSSTDPALNQKCSKCREVLLECLCVIDDAVEIQKIKAVIRVEKQARAGKIVTIIGRLPRNEIFLKDLTARLKKKCGAGGTFIMHEKEGLIEIQGDKRVLIREFLEREKISCKG